MTVSVCETLNSWVTVTETEAEKISKLTPPPLSWKRYCCSPQSWTTVAEIQSLRWRLIVCVRRYKGCSL